jgi:hypothetical protein
LFSKKLAQRVRLISDFMRFALEHVAHAQTDVEPRSEGFAGLLFRGCFGLRRDHNVCHNFFRNWGTGRRLGVLVSEKRLAHFFFRQILIHVASRELDVLR